MEETNTRKRPAPRGTAAYPRKRAVTACQTCRARRTKCDNLKPKCSFCLRTGATCVQSAVDLSSFDPASLHIIRRLDELETILHSAVRTQERRGDSDARQQSDDSNDRERSITPPPSAPLARHLILPPEPECLYELANAGSTQPCLASVLKRPCEIIRSPNANTQIPHGAVDAELDGPTCRRLLDNFLNYVHIKNPILQEEALRRLVHSQSMRGLDWSSSSCLTLLICALGAISTRFGSSHSTSPGSIAYATSEAYFAAAKKRLGACLIDGDLVAAQCLFLAGVYLLTTFRPFDGWRMFSQALACCQSFDFEEHVHLDSSQASPATNATSPRDEAAKQAIYWSSWKSEEESRISLNMPDFPPGSSRSETDSPYPTFFPTPSLSMPSPESPSSILIDETQARESRGWYFYLAEISLKRLYRRLSGEISQTQNFAQVRSRLDDHLRQIDEWVQALPPSLSLDADAADDDVCKFVLRGHLHNCFEMIYWPFAAGLIFQPSAYVTTGQSGELWGDQEDTPRLITTAFSYHVQRIYINKAGFTHRHHGTWGMIRSCTRSALVLAHASSVCRLMISPVAGSILPYRWREAVDEVIQLNRYWMKESPELQRHVTALEQAMRTG
jgi:hypothetical protein